MAAMSIVGKIAQAEPRLDDAARRLRRSVTGPVSATSEIVTIPWNPFRMPPASSVAAWTRLSTSSVAFESRFIASAMAEAKRQASRLDPAHPEKIADQPVQSAPPSCQAALLPPKEIFSKHGIPFQHRVLPPEQPRSFVP